MSDVTRAEICAIAIAETFRDAPCSPTLCWGDTRAQSPGAARRVEEARHR